MALARSRSVSLRPAFAVRRRRELPSGVDGAEATDPDSLLGGAGDSGEGFLGAGHRDRHHPPAGVSMPRAAARRAALSCNRFGRSGSLAKASRAPRAAPAAAGAKPVS